MAKTVNKRKTSGASILGCYTGVPQNRGNGLVFECLRSKWGPVDREGCGVPQNRGNGLVLERLRFEIGSCSSIIYCLAPATTGYCSSTADLLQPPPATVHPRLLFIQPPPATVHPASTGSCSSTPNWLGCGGLLGVLYIQWQWPTTM